MGTIGEAGSGGSSFDYEECGSASLLVVGGEAADGPRASRPARPCRRWPKRYGVNANLLFTWRRRDARSAARGGAQPSELLAVTVADAGAPAAPFAAPRPVDRMEIVLVGGERIIIGADVDATALARVVKALSRR